MNRKWIQARQGSALISAAIGAAILGIVAASLLAMLSNEYNFNFRSRSWNQALHLAEAGVEIGFAEVNNQYYRGGNGVGFQSSRGWSSSSNVYSKNTSLTNSAGIVVRDVAISVMGVGGVNPIVTSISTVNTTPRGPSISRGVRASLYAASMFPAGMLAKNSINMNGNNIYVDSYDSTDVTKSTSGLYDAAKRQSNGNIASNGSVLNSLSIGNADIYGTVYTGPNGTATLGANGSVGPTLVNADRATTVAAAEAKGWIEHDFNVDVADPTLPTGASTWTSPPGSTAGSINKDVNVNTGDYKVNNISLSSNSHKDTLTIDGNVRIYVTGDVNLSGISQIVINPGASLQIYVAGSVSAAGNGIINNSSTPIKNQWYGLNSSTSWSYTGNAQWIGTIYAPSASVSFKGGGSSGDASGSVVANNITLAGQVQFHYDEALRASDTGAGYTVATWQELRNVSGTWTP